MIEIIYDENGLISTKEQLNDDGLISLFVYDQAGQVSSAYMSDGARDTPPQDNKKWDEIWIEYDSNGHKTSKAISLDNGMTQAWLYQDGAVRSYYVDDGGTDETPNGVKSWASREKHYDQDGNLQEARETLDNGLTEVETFENDTLIFRQRLDRTADDEMRDFRRWDQIDTSYDSNGDLAGREVHFDNGDVRALIYEAGQKSVKLQFDGDESHSWLLRETLFNENGRAAQVNTYDTAQDVPEEYGFLSPTL